MFSLSSLYAHLGKIYFELRRRKGLKVETLNQLFNTSDISLWFIWVSDEFLQYWILFGAHGWNGKSGFMSFFSDGCISRCCKCQNVSWGTLLFLKLCSLVMPPLLQGTERKLPCSGACVLRALCVNEFSKREKNRVAASCARPSSG